MNSIKIEVECLAREFLLTHNGWTIKCKTPIEVWKALKLFLKRAA